MNSFSDINMRFTVFNFFQHINTHSARRLPIGWPTAVPTGSYRSNNHDVGFYAFSSALKDFLTTTPILFIHTFIEYHLCACKWWFLKTKTVTWFSLSKSPIYAGCGCSDELLDPNELMGISSMPPVSQKLRPEKCYWKLWKRESRLQREAPKENLLLVSD